MEQAMTSNREPMVFESNQSHLMVVVCAVCTKGNGDAFLNMKTHTSLSNGGGQAGQGYPCVLIVKKDDEDINRKKIL